MKNIDDNKIIASFMGIELFTDGISWFDKNFKSLDKYHEDWNSLMPVVNKITNMHDQLTYYQVGYIFEELRGYLYCADIENTYTQVIEFIKEYNEDVNECFTEYKN